MIWYTNEDLKGRRKQVFVSSFYEEGDFKVNVIDEEKLNKTGDEEIFFTSKENLIYLGVLK